jgi:hypothetical protein
MHLYNEKIIITGKNSNMASTAGLLISILTAGWCFMWNLVGCSWVGYRHFVGGHGVRQSFVCTTPLPSPSLQPPSLVPS